MLQACLEVFAVKPLDPNDATIGENCAHLSDTLLQELQDIHHVKSLFKSSPDSKQDCLCVSIYEKTKLSLLKEACSTLLPAAVARHLQYGTPSCGVGAGALLVGGSGAGKTALLQQIEEILHLNVHTITHVRTLDCAELKNKPLDTVLNELSEVFQASALYPTSLVLLDNVDHISPAGKETGIGTLRDERSSALTMHLELLLRKNYLQQQKRVQALLSMQSKSEFGSSAFNTERMQELLLKNTTYVIASAESLGSVASSLLQALHVRTLITIETLGEKNRVVALRAALQGLEITLAESNNSEIDRLTNAMQGYRIVDVQNVARRVCSTVLRRHARETSTRCLVATVDDVLTVTTSYTPVSGASKLRSQDSAVGTTATSWNDVGGYHGAKQEILDTIKTPLVFGKLFRQCPIKLPRSVLLYGPPGCGKTLLAQAAGREFGRGFISIRGPELLDKYIGASEKAVRELFQRAQESGRPCLIFFDEFESLAPRRGKDNTGVTDRIVNQLLTFIDGVESNMGGGSQDHEEDDNGADAVEGQVFIMAATSRPDLIDAALLRPGRIEKHIYIGLPDEADRRAILHTALSALPASPEALHSTVPWMTSHERAALLSAADWRAVVNTAFLAATHDFIEHKTGSTTGVVITAEHLKNAFLSTKASITGPDLSFFDSVYQRFNKGAAVKDGAVKSSSTVRDEQLKQAYV